MRMMRNLVRVLPLEVSTMGSIGACKELNIAEELNEDEEPNETRNKM